MLVELELVLLDVVELEVVEPDVVEPEVVEPEVVELVLEDVEPELPVLDVEPVEEPDVVEPVEVELEVEPDVVDPDVVELVLDVLPLLEPVEELVVELEVVEPEVLEVEPVLLVEPVEEDVLELEPPVPVQFTPPNEPSWLPCIPKLAVCPGAKLPFQLMLLAEIVLPDSTKFAFQPPVLCGASAKAMSTCQLLTAELPLLVTSISS